MEQEFPDIPPDTNVILIAQHEPVFTRFVSMIGDDVEVISLNKIQEVLGKEFDTTKKRLFVGFLKDGVSLEELIGGVGKYAFLSSAILSVYSEPTGDLAQFIRHKRSATSVVLLVGEAIGELGWKVKESVGSKEPRWPSDVRWNDSPLPVLSTCPKQFFDVCLPLEDNKE